MLTIFLTEIIAAHNEVPLVYHRVCGVYFLAVVFAVTKNLFFAFFILASLYNLDLSLKSANRCGRNVQSTLYSYVLYTNIIYYTIYTLYIINFYNIHNYYYTLLL